MIIKFKGRVFDIRKSTRKHKKYDVYENDNYLLSFGDNRYEQYYDRIGDYHDKNHLDEKRKKAYYKRHGEDAELFTAKWFSHHFLW